MTARDDIAKVLRDEIKRRTLPRVGWEPEQAWMPKQYAFGATEHDLADALLASPALARLLDEARAEAWDQGFKQGGPMHDVDYDNPGSHRINPYRKDTP